MPGKSRSCAWSVATALTTCFVILQADAEELEDVDVPGTTHSVAGSIHTSCLSMRQSML